MSVGKQLLFSVLSQEDAALKKRHLSHIVEHGFTEESFIEADEGKAFAFMRDHFLRYGVVPSLALVEVETDLSFPTHALHEPFEFWFEEFRKFLCGVELARLAEDLEDLVGSSRIESAIDCVTEYSSRIRALTQDRRTVTTLGEAAEQVLERHRLMQTGQLHDGVRIGFPYIDSVTGGIQPGDFWVIAGESGTGKCLGKGTPVLMFDGTIKPVEDVRVGDLLMGPDSKPRTVLSLARGREEMFRVTPTKGDPYVVNRSHILSLKGIGRYAKRGIVNISVEDWLNAHPTFRRVHVGWRTGVEWGGSDLPDTLPPYILGAWLGDGVATYPRVTTADQVVLDEFKKFADSCNLFCLPVGQDGSSTTWSIANYYKGRVNDFLRSLQQLRLIGNKHIPHQYRTASRNDRLELLAGLMDTDGSKSCGGYEITQKRKQLAEDICFVARSLGFAAYMKECRKTCTNNGKSGTYWRVFISGDCSVIPVRVARKKIEARKQVKNVLHTGIKVESIGEGDYYGFEIDGDRLFMLGDFTVTHNTYVSCRSALGAVNQGKKALLVGMEMQNLQMARRNLALGANISAMNMRLGRMSAFAVEQVQAFLRQWRDTGHEQRLILVEGQIRMTVDDLMLHIHEHRPDVVFVDGAYMLRMGGSFKARWEMNMDVMESLKQVAMSMNIGIVGSFQFDQKVKGVKGLANIMGGQAIGQIASVVLGIENEQASRDNYGLEEFKELTLFKGREGERGRIRLRYDMARTSIEQVEVLDGYDDVIRRSQMQDAPDPADDDDTPSESHDDEDVLL